MIKTYQMYGFKAELNKEIYVRLASAPEMVKSDYIFVSMIPSFNQLVPYIPGIGSNVVSESSRDGYAKAKVKNVTLMVWDKDIETNYIVGEVKEIKFTDNEKLQSYIKATK